MHSLRPDGAGERNAPGLEVEHRTALGPTHERLRAAARGDAHLDTAAGIRRGEEGLGPGRVIAVDEDLLGAVKRHGLGVGDQPAHPHLQLEGLLDRALHEQAGGAHGCTDAHGDGVRRSISQDRHGGLDLAEAEGRSCRRVGGQQERIVGTVGDMRLVAWGASCPALGHRHDELGGAEYPQGTREFGGRHTGCKPDDLVARNSGIHAHAREDLIIDRHGLWRDLEVYPVVGDESVEKVEVLSRAGVHLHNHAVGDHQRGLGITGRVVGQQAERWIGDREAIQIDPLLIHEAEAADPIGHVQASA